MESESQLPAGQPSGPRGVFFEEEGARSVLGRLRSDGWEAALTRGHFSGEDDDEDQPWIVTSDAPGLVLELLVEEHDGWFEDVPPAPASPVPPLPPMDLPVAPKRIKRPDLGSSS
jgi:hypothetical protein